MWLHRLNDRVECSVAQRVLTAVYRSVSGVRGGGRMRKRGRGGGKNIRKYTKDICCALNITVAIIMLFIYSSYVSIGH